ncbi:MAG: protein kinase domain-containing protein [Gemmatimonadaceae bacterium]
MTSADRPTGGAGPLPSRDEWRLLEPLIDAVLDAPPERRSKLLAQLSGGDAIRRAELERLVAQCERSYSPLEGAAAEQFAAMLGDEEAPPMPESLAGRYRLVREVGRGGMAIVYLARDLKHGRDVAVKIVRPDVAAALGPGRFLREIEIAARLRHPHIVPLYDSGEELVASDDPERGDAGPPLLYYVMPYEVGHSLRERLTLGGPLSVEETVRVLQDVCEALSHAHQHGIVHRDVKPDNVLLSGRNAMVTDFGVARAVSEAAEATLPVGRLTLGTPAYMAPEQVANDPRVDHRTDIYAVGVLAYELLVGRPPVPAGARGRSTASRAFDAARLLPGVRPDVPDALVDVIARCLSERPADRWQSADELLEQLASFAPRGSAATGPARRRSSRVLTFVGAAVVAALSAAIAIGSARERGERPALLLGRAVQLTADRGLEVEPSISPDGRRVAYAAGHSLRMHIFLRTVAGGKPVRLIRDTAENEWLPRWSPDGTRILFLSRGGVFSAPASGGPARQEVPSRPGVIVTSATWSPDGREIAFVRGDSLLARLVRSGRDRLVTTEFDLHSCAWSPDGDRLACVSGNHFYVTVGAIFGLGPMFGNLAPSRIVLIPAAGGGAVSVTDSISLHQSPVWSRDGRTLYYVSNRQGPRDVYALDVGRHARADREPVRVTTGIGAQSIDFSSDGARMVYAAYSSSANIWAMPIPNRPSGSASSAVQLTSGNQTVEGVRVSPDGRWVVYDSDLSGNSDVYRVPVTGGEPERLTRAPMDEFRGALSPSGKELVYHTFQTGSRNLFLLPLDGGPIQQLTRSTAQRSMANWSPDGTALTFFDMVTADVFVMRRNQRGRWGTPRFVGGRGWRPEWSPDGRTIVFASATDGRISAVPADSGAQRDLYVPHNEDPLAELAVFSTDGRELFFKSHDAQGRASFWSIPASGGRPRLLVRFDDPARASNRFEFASDGRRFYFTIEDRQSDIWVAEVTKK